MNTQRSFVLAFDTANEVIAIGLGKLDAATQSIECVASVEVEARRASNTQLLPRIDELCAQAGVGRGEIACVAVGRGPGSFTGVRIALACAKGIASALEVGLVGVSSLDAVAWGAWKASEHGSLLVVADAMRREVYPVEYRLSDAGAERVTADRVIKADAFAEELDASGGSDRLIAGDALRKYADLFEGAGALLPEALWTPTGAGLLMALRASWRAGECDPLDAERHDPAFALPVYTRLSDAEENEQARLAKMTDPRDAQKRERLQREIERTDRAMRVSRPKSEGATEGAATYEPPFILAIESSCDETAAAVIDGGRDVLADCIASQIDFHKRFGGVVPEIASRKHTEAIVPTVMYTMEQAGLGFGDLSAVACTIGPGLVGALVVGVAFAKGLCFATGLPFIGVNHLEGHLYANRYVDPTLEPPFVALLVSGGHTMLVHVRGWGDYEVLGSTLDDAVGEAFDKVAKALELGYPGGPVLSRYAKDGDAKAIAFPRAMMHSGDLRFSLSGLKTAVITYINEQNKAGMSIDIPDLAASFTAAVVDVLVAKSLDACKQTGSRVLCIGGGVAANPDLREALAASLGKRGIRVIMPELSDCADNASMIASVGLDLFEAGERTGLDADPQAHMPLRTRE